MASSNILSRFLPPGSASVYEAIRQHDAESNVSDVEERAGIAFNDDPQDHFSDHELEEALADARESSSPSPSSPFLSHDDPSPRQRPGGAASGHRRRWLQESPPGVETDDRDDDVPPSLLIEGQEEADHLNARPPPGLRNRSDSRPPVPGPSTRQNRAHWETARAQQPLHPISRGPPPPKRWTVGQHPNLAAVDPKEKAMWRWANVENLDNFLKDVYEYYMGNGIWSIMLSRALNLLYVSQKKRALTHTYTL